MTSEKLAFVSFEPRGGSFVGFLSIEFMTTDERDLERVLSKATKVYERSIVKMSSILGEIENARSNGRLVPAHKIWDIGHEIFQLKDRLERLSLELDGLYHHLVRDLDVKRKWLEKVVIFRRYLPNRKLIPESLNWGRCEKGTRRVALKLVERSHLD